MTDIAMHVSSGTSYATEEDSKTEEHQEQIKLLANFFDISLPLAKNIFELLHKQLVEKQDAKTLIQLYTTVSPNNSNLTFFFRTFAFHGTLKICDSST